MRDFSSDLLYLVLLALVFFGQHVLQWLRQYLERRRAAAVDEAEPAAQAPVDEEGTDLEAVPLSQLAGELLEELRPDPVPLEPAPAPPPRVHPRPVRRYSRQALLGSKRQTQDAVVASVILGPCRAHQPYARTA